MNFFLQITLLSVPTLQNFLNTLIINKNNFLIIKMII